MSRPVRGLGAVVVAAALAGCSAAGPDVAERVSQAAARAAAGDATAALRGARLIAEHGPVAGTLDRALELANQAAAAGSLEGRLWQAILSEATGRQQQALAVWAQVVADPAAPTDAVAVAAARVRALLDRAPWPDDLVASLASGVARRDAAGALAAEALEAAGIRLGDPGIVTQARSRRGVIQRYRHTERLAARPALSRLAPLAEALDAPQQRGAAEGGGLLSPAISTPDGTVGLPEAGPGVFAVAIRWPQDPDVSEWLVELDGEPAVRAFVAGVEVAGNPRLTALGPRRTRFVVARPTASLELHVASRAAAPQVVVAVRPVPTPPSGAIADAAVRVWSHLELARVDGDSARLAEAVAQARAIGGPVLRLAVAGALTEDPTRPGSLTRATALREVEALTTEVPELAAARAALVVATAEDGDVVRAVALAEAGPLRGFAPAVGLALAEARGQVTDAAARAVVLYEQLPHSCWAAGRLLDADWDRLVHAPQRLGTLPGCFPLQLRAASLERSAWRLEAAAARVERLTTEASPGRQRARLTLIRARLALSRGDLAMALSEGRAALREAVDREASLELLGRVAGMAGDVQAGEQVREQLLRLPHISPLARRAALDPARDIGLPLARGGRIALQALVAGEAAAGASVEILLDERHTRVLGDGAMIHRVHRIVRLLDEHAVEQYGEIALPDEAEVLRARTWKPTDDGRLQPIEPEDIVETSTISLPALTPGAITEVAWFWFERPTALHGDGWRAPGFYFESDRGATRVARYVLRAPPGQPLSVRADPGVPEPLQPEPGVLAFEMTERPRVVPEPLDPRPERRRLSVLVESGVDDTVVSAGARDVVRSNTVVTPVVRQLVDEALVDTPRDRGPRAVLEALYRHLVANVSDGAATPLGANASYAAASRLGERSVLLVAMCHAVGIDCAVVLARPHSYGALSEDVRASLDTYVYPVVRARLASGDVWLDPSSRFGGFGYVPPLVQGADGMSLDPRDAPRERVPPTPAGHGGRGIDMTIDVAADGSWIATGDETIRGFFAMSWRQALIDMDSDGREAALQRLVQGSLPGADVEILQLGPLDAVTVPLALRWRATGRLVSASGGGDALTVGLSPDYLARATVKLAERTTPLLVNRAAALELKLVVNVPRGWRIPTAPPPIVVSHPLVQLTRYATLSDGGRTLTTTKSFDLDLGLVPPDEYAEWRAAAAAVDRADVLHLVLQSGAP